MPITALESAPRRFSCPQSPGGDLRLAAATARRAWLQASAPPAWDILALVLAILSGLSSAGAQEQRKRKVPVLDKITAGGPSRQAFSGNIQSLDLKRELLNVNTVQGGNTEIFPVKKGVRVTAADGRKLKVAALTPGTNVIVYYEQKGDRRTVKEIIVLASAAAEDKKKSRPSS